MKEKTRQAFDQAKQAYESAQAVYAKSGTSDNYAAMMKAKKSLESARRKAFQFWSAGDPPLL